MKKWNRDDVINTARKALHKTRFKESEPIDDNSLI
jgi:hypothetical protein